jgi:hypothetical protein
LTKTLKKFFNFLLIYLKKQISALAKKKRQGPLGRKKIERWEDKNNQPHQLHEAATWPKGPQSYFYLTKTLKKFFNLLLIYLTCPREAEAAARPFGPVQKTNISR